jgi:hypothetical protein
MLNRAAGRAYKSGWSCRPKGTRMLAACIQGSEQMHLYGDNRRPTQMSCWL